MDHESLFLEMLQRIEARQESGFNGLNARLDALNGRTRKNSEAIAVLEDRTESMTCVEHAERFKAIEKAVERIEAHEPPSRVKSWAISSGAVAGAIALFEGIWQLVSK